MLIPKKESLQLTQAIADIVNQDVYPDISTRFPAFLDLFRYKVPISHRLTFTPNHTFAILAQKLSEGLLGAVTDDGGVQVNETVAANNATANDIHLTPAVPTVNDAFYFGYEFLFTALRINVGTNGVGTWTIIWEYWNGSAWAALPGITDGTTGFTAGTGNKDVTWTIPSNWAKTEVLGITGYWIRARVSAYTAVTTQPLGTQSWVHYATALNATDKFRVEVRDAEELQKHLLIPTIQYRQVGDFQDPKKRYRLDLSEIVVANEGQWVVVLVKADAPVDASECYFVLTCERERGALIK